jgi:hypothetical protein
MQRYAQKYTSIYLITLLFIIQNGLKPLHYDSKTLTLTWIGLSTYASDFYKSCRALLPFPFVMPVFLIFYHALFHLVHFAFITALTPKKSYSNSCVFSNYVIGLRTFLIYVFTLMLHNIECSLYLPI